MPDILGRAASVKNSLRDLAFEQIRRRRLGVYLKSERRPWTTGYGEFREQSLRAAVHDKPLLKTFRAGHDLPTGYGHRLDARIVEIPWTVSNVPTQTGNFLDAGSALNYDFVLTSPALQQQKVTIVTLAPEGEAFWRLGVSYHFGDLRKLDFRDELFDMVACISTIEHIGMDNSMYAGDADIARRGDPTEFLLAVSELRRVLKPGGKLCISFPFGRYENHGWFQQFDAPLLDQLVTSFQPSELHENIFRYETEGWRRSNRHECADCEFFDVHESKQFKPGSSIDLPADYAAGERAVACLALNK
jgi:SAM-dependent methyltransferase